MKTDERLRELARSEKEAFEVPQAMHDMVEDTLAELPEAQPVRRPRYWKIPATIAAAFLAVSTRASKALGSAMASSDRALRFSSMPACFRPYMNQL